MKNIFYLFVLLFTAFTISCDDSFLEENKKQQEEHLLDVLIVEPAAEFTEASITVDELRNSDFKVVLYPKIIHFESLTGHIDDTGLLTLKIKVDEFPSQNNVGVQNLGTIVLNIAGKGLYVIPVGYINIGEPSLNINPTIISHNFSLSYIDFGPSNQEKKFSIMAGYAGVLMYQITEYPSWITFSSSNTSGTDDLVILNPNEQIEYAISVKRDNIAPGNYEGNIVFNSNDVHKQQHTLKVSMIVRDKTTTLSVLPIEGKVVDCAFDKQSNTLFVASQEPNKIQVFDIVNNAKKEEINLSKNLTSLSISEDGKKLFAGQSGILTIFDVASLALLKEIPTTFVLNDALDAMDGFFYSSNKTDYVGNSRSNLYQFNTLTEEWKNFSTIDNHIIGGYMLKLKNIPYLLTTRTTNTPTGLHLIDISNGNPELIKYWHQDLGQKLWQTNDGTRIIGSEGNIFKTPDRNTGNEIIVSDTLKPQGVKTKFYDTQGFKWFDESVQTKSIWGVYYGSSSVIEYGFNYPQVLEWNSTTYEIKRQINYSDYKTTIDRQNKDYPTLPHYIFSNTAGNRIILIKNVLNDNYTEVNAWSLEIIDVSK